MPSADVNRDVFHSRFNRVLALAVWALVALLIVSGLASGVLFGHPALVAPAALLALAAWVGLWNPAVAVNDHGATIVNVARTVVIPWTALIDVDTKYALELRTPGKAYSAWAAPAPGRAGAALARRIERGQDRRPGSPGAAGSARPGDLLGSESGEAAYMVRTRWQELVADGRVEAGIAHEAAVAVHWHWAALGAAVVLTAISAFALGWLG